MKKQNKVEFIEIKKENDGNFILKFKITSDIYLSSLDESKLNKEFGSLGLEFGSYKRELFDWSFFYLYLRTTYFEKRLDIQSVLKKINIDNVMDRLQDIGKFISDEDIEFEKEVDKFIKELSARNKDVVFDYNKSNRKLVLDFNLIGEMIDDKNKELRESFDDIFLVEIND